jgi:23S rRNA (guanosine2251-2'-O)-methyltransferase
MAKDHLFGVHAVEEWLDAAPERISAILVMPNPGDRPAKLVERARAKGVAVRTIARADLEKMAGPRNAQGVAAEVHAFPFANLDTCLAGSSNPLVLIVDGVTDPQNLGAILRSAAFFGVTAVVLPMDRAASITPVVERTAAGGAARVPICQAPSLLKTVEDLKARGLRISAAVVGGSVPLPSASLEGGGVLIVGSEGQGIRPSVRKLADQRVALRSGHLESLNVATFTALFLYEASRQRGAFPVGAPTLTLELDAE